MRHANAREGYGHATAALPTWDSAQSLQDLLAERLRRAPWLVLSVALHATAAALLWLLLPPEVKRQIENHVQLLAQEVVDVVVPPPPPQVDPVIEPTVDAPVTSEPRAVVDAATVDASVDTGSRDTGLESAVPSDSLSTPIGIGSSAVGRYGDRGGGKGKGGGRPYATNIDAGLQWLKNHQDEDGRWDCDGFSKHDDPSSDMCDGPGNATHDVGVTGLALLAFLGDGSTMRSGPYAPVIKKGVNWLRKQQDPATGLFGARASHEFIYDHAIAAYAMCEAFGLSGYESLRDVAQNGINYLESHRNPYSVWRYQPHDGENDTSVTGWCIMAYESGEFFKLTINKEALKACEQWLDQVSDPSGKHGYQSQGSLSARKGSEHEAKFPPDKGAAMTAVGLFCRYFMNQDPKEKPVMNAAADLILSKPPIWDEKAGTIDHYYWYYATYALFQKGGSHWTKWQKLLETAVVKNQHLDKAKKNLYGSWDPKCAWGEDGGRVYSTATLVLTLEAMYRYTRLVR